MTVPEPELGEHHWSERPACGRGDCTASALSFARFCWTHLADQKVYAEKLKRRAATLAGLAGLNLEGVRLKDASCPRTNFAGANLRGADFSGGDFSGANFEGAEMTSATLRAAALAHVDFTGADLSFANLRGADLTHAELRYASLAHADLSAAKLTRAHGDETDLAGAFLKDADLRGATLRRASLARAQLEGALLAGARLENCDLAAADLQSADFYGGIFRETDLGRALLPPDLKVTNDGPTRYAEAAEVYAELKLNFRQFGRYGLAETALYREMVARRRARRANAKVWPPFALARDILDVVFLDFYAGYGTRPWRIVRALVLAWGGFALYYYLLPFFGRLGSGLTSYVDPGGGVPAIADLSVASLERCLYFSFVTLTKLGFTAYEPYGWAKVAAGMEGSFAIVSYTVLLVSVARKIWR